MSAGRRARSMLGGCAALVTGRSTMIWRAMPVEEHGDLCGLRIQPPLGACRSHTGQYGKVGRVQLNAHIPQIVVCSSP